MMVLSGVLVLCDQILVKPCCSLQSEEMIVAVRFSIGSS